MSRYFKFCYAHVPVYTPAPITVIHDKINLHWRKGSGAIGAGVGGIGAGVGGIGAGVGGIGAGVGGIGAGVGAGPGEGAGAGPGEGAGAGPGEGAGAEGASVFCSITGSFNISCSSSSFSTGIKIAYVRVHWVRHNF